MSDRPIQPEELPPQQRRTVEHRRRKPGSKSTTERLLLAHGLAPEVPPTASAATAEEPAATSEDLIELTRKKLCSALTAMQQHNHGDVSRLAHAVAHLTQAAVSLQRWNERVSQRDSEHKRVVPEAKSKVRGGLSPETSLALRKALLGIAPFNPQPAALKGPNANETHAPPGEPVSQVPQESETSTPDPAAVSETRGRGRY